MSIYSKIIKTKRVLITPELPSEAELMQVKHDLGKKVKKLFGGSLAIRAVDAGSSEGEEQELTALSNPYYDLDRFGIHFVASPRHADMLMVTGPVTRNMASALMDAYEATPEPKIVVAVGDSAIDGGIYRGSYAVLDGVHTVIPVHYQIPGNPPSAKAILGSLLQILDKLEQPKGKQR
jgi:Ni,Fe-hydrogenase III small subunit